MQRFCWKRLFQWAGDRKTCQVRMVIISCLKQWKSGATRYQDIIMYHHTATPQEKSSSWSSCSKTYWARLPQFTWWVIEYQTKRKGSKTQGDSEVPLVHFLLLQLYWEVRGNQLENISRSQKEKLPDDTHICNSSRGYPKVSQTDILSTQISANS